MNLSNKKVKTFLAGLTLVAMAAVTYPYTSVYEHKSVRVTDKLKNKAGESLVYTDKGTFKVVDTWAFLRFNSSDILGKIEEGQVYNFKASGQRIGFLSWYENIISFEKVIDTDK